MIGKLENFNVTQLKQMISFLNKELKFEPYSKMKKEDLIKALRGHKMVKVIEKENEKPRFKLSNGDILDLPDKIFEKKTRKKKKDEKKKDDKKDEEKKDEEKKDEEKKDEEKKEEEKKEEPKKVDVYNFVKEVLKDGKPEYQEIVVNALNDLYDEILDQILDQNLESKYLKPDGFFKPDILNNPMKLYDILNSKVSKDFKEEVDNYFQDFIGDVIPLEGFKEPDTREAVIEDDLEYIRDLITKSQKTPVPFECYIPISNYIYLKILDKYKNDCVFTKVSDGKGNLVEFDPDDVNYSTNNMALKITELRKVKVKELLFEAYEKCKSKGKMLVLPINIVGEKHRNLIVFNPFTNDIEHYEPHGAEYDGAGRKDNIDGLIEGLTKSFNKELKKKKEKPMSYSPSLASCPILSEETRKKVNEELKKKNYQPIKQNVGLQSIDARASWLYKTKKEKDKIKNLEFTDTGGFCCMWSFLQLEFRLKNPKVPANKLSSLLLSEFKENPIKMTKEFIRGYTNSFVKELRRILGDEDYLKLGGIQQKKVGKRAKRIDTSFTPQARVKFVNAMKKLYQKLI